MVSLGCPKTLVDSEVILGKLDPAQYKIVPSGTDCDVALLNTCTFIEDARKESVDRILEMVQLKKEKRIQKLIVMGCLVQRFPADLQKELEEVDAFIGSGDYAKIPEIVEGVQKGERVVSVGAPGYLSTSAEARVALTPKHYRYIKISEGCDHICSFCSIPSFRGKHRSRSIEDVVLEAQRMIQDGTREIILTGQDTTYFGKDRTGEFLLPELLRQMDQLPGGRNPMIPARSADFDNPLFTDYWIRLLYVYPSCVTPELMEALRDSKHLCRYLDMPLQHISDAMLLAMRRGITKRRTVDLVRKFRETVPGLAIRTTFIVGFPGETEKDFEELLEFMEEIKFERVGIFRYSFEEGTHSASLPRQVPEKIKRERFDKAMLLQQRISRENNRKFLGRTLQVLIDGPFPKDPKKWTGRSYQDAPEIDGTVRVTSKKLLLPGEFYPVTITDFHEYDLVGQV